jgi:hypothetical protein
MEMAVYKFYDVFTHQVDIQCETQDGAIWTFGNGPGHGPTNTPASDAAEWLLSKDLARRGELVLAWDGATPVDSAIVGDPAEDRNLGRTRAVKFARAVADRRKAAARSRRLAPDGGMFS